MTLRSVAGPVFLAVVVTAACSSAEAPSMPDGGTDSGGTTSGTGGGGNGVSPCGIPAAVAGEAGATAAVIIQEDELGFSGVDGVVVPRQASTNVTGPGT